MSINGIYKWTAKYDERRNPIEFAYYGFDGKPCMIKSGYAIWARKFDERGKCIEAAYFDTEGKPCLSNEGAAKVTYTYDSREVIRSNCRCSI